MTQEKTRFLVVMAHPHDFMCVAGTCAIHAAAGDQIIEDYGETKTAELRAAAAEFGVTDVRGLGFTDKPFVVEWQPESVEAVRELVLEIRPHVVITQSSFGDRQHGMASIAQNDHTEVAAAVLKGKESAELSWVVQTVPDHVAPLTLFPGVYFPPEQWSLAVDFTDQFEARVRAESKFASQGYDEEYGRRWVEVELGHQGMRSLVPYAKEFVQQRPQTVSCIELSEHSLRRAVAGRRQE